MFEIITNHEKIFIASNLRYCTIVKFDLWSWICIRFCSSPGMQRVALWEFKPCKCYREALVCSPPTAGNPCIMQGLPADWLKNWPGHDRERTQQSSPLMMVVMKCKKTGIKIVKNMRGKQIQWLQGTVLIAFFTLDFTLFQKRSLQVRTSVFPSVGSELKESKQKWPRLLGVLHISQCRQEAVPKMQMWVCKAMYHVWTLSRTSIQPLPIMLG